eukprot:SAG11_NODE_2834_length_2922_cov_7.241233_1_plen_91_part_00
MEYKIIKLDLPAGILSRHGYNTSMHACAPREFFQVPTVGFTTFEYTYNIALQDYIEVSGLYCMCTPENRVHTKISRKKFRVPARHVSGFE